MGFQPALSAAGPSWLSNAVLGGSRGSDRSENDSNIGGAEEELIDGGGGGGGGIGDWERAKCMDAMDTMGFGPLVPTESERSLMERVRLELKHELKQGYKEKLVDIREEILRKRRAGKLPGDTTSVLKSWWQSHSKWPYPTEEDKARLVQETRLQLKQINNWFINQRKRNWHSNPSGSTVKSKRKKLGRRL
ncbi:Homeobox protein knotted-1-like 3 [Linum perenne]